MSNNEEREQDLPQSKLKKTICLSGCGARPNPDYSHDEYQASKALLKAVAGAEAYVVPDAIYAQSIEIDHKCSAKTTKPKPFVADYSKEATEAAIKSLADKINNIKPPTFACDIAIAMANIAKAAFALQDAMGKLSEANEIAVAKEKQVEQCLQLFQAKQVKHKKSHARMLVKVLQDDGMLPAIAAPLNGSKKNGFVVC